MYLNLDQVLPQQALAEAGTDTRPQMLDKGSCVPWSSRFLRVLDGKKEEGDLFEVSNESEIHTIEGEVSNTLKVHVLSGVDTNKDIGLGSNPASEESNVFATNFHVENCWDS
ncbi:hypothetical protein Tco_0909657 [Tanacetum coccineum]|uniref:Uncharacterized protein n=1 Tax=Tanacetum coccineum TaxID=301880 RepID=A0ABQ5CSC3_9ASTR